MKHWVLAVRGRSAGTLPRDWQDRVLEMPGVRLLGGNSRRLQILADEPVIQGIRDRFASLLLIEEAEPRQPQSEGAD